ncbi:MAG: peptidoglycan DD-metalloendopeptidase family protein [Bifidobacteriaceae bacterium]|jgi:murein DD-endopeptidase MepM/ murein hydrolase activator NlpD|nr:peptidoglycan DD-metalloendopeptidase family protein [Bifidobacteriaceae bacterium]
MGKRTRFGSAAVSVLALAALLVGGLASPSGAAKDRDQLEQERAANQRQIDQLRTDLEGTDTKLQEAYISLQTAERELPIAQAAVETSKAEFATAQKDHDEIVAALKQAEAQKAEVTAQLQADVELARASQLSLGALARDSMMGTAAGGSELMVLLGASSIDDAARDLMAAEAAARTRQSVIVQAQQSAGANKNRKARLESVTQEIAELEVKAADALAKAEAAKEAAAQAKLALEQLKESMTALAADLKAKKAADEAKLKETEAEKKKVDDELDRLLEEERKKSNIPPPSDGGPPPVADGVFGRPLTSIRVSSPFGWRIHPIYGTRRLHAGVDLSASCGTPIYASAAGKVIFTGWAGGYGNRVVISHGNVGGQLMFSTYNHIVAGGISVSSGQSVSQGSQIANVGTTGASTGCHLHFEIGVGSATGVVNPMNYIS